MNTSDASFQGASQNEAHHSPPTQISAALRPALSCHAELSLRLRPLLGLRPLLPLRRDVGLGDLLLVDIELALSEDRSWMMTVPGAP